LVEVSLAPQAQNATLQQASVAFQRDSGGAEVVDQTLVVLGNGAHPYLSVTLSIVPATVPQNDRRFHRVSH
jgi:hypothetical protein